MDKVYILILLKYNATDLDNTVNSFLLENISSTFLEYKIFQFNS